MWGTCSPSTDPLFCWAFEAEQNIYLASGIWISKVIRLHSRSHVPRLLHSLAPQKQNLGKMSTYNFCCLQRNMSRINYKWNWEDCYNFHMFGYKGVVLWHQKCKLYHSRRNCFVLYFFFLNWVLLYKFSFPVLLFAAWRWSSEEDAGWTNSPWPCEGRRHWCSRLTERLIVWMERFSFGCWKVIGFAIQGHILDVKTFVPPISKFCALVCQLQVYIYFKFWLVLCIFSLSFVIV